MRLNNTSIVDVVAMLGKEPDSDAIYTAVTRLGISDTLYVDVAGNVLEKSAPRHKIDEDKSIAVYDREFNSYTIIHPDGEGAPFINTDGGLRVDKVVRLRNALIERDGSYRPTLMDGTEIFEEGELDQDAFMQHLRLPLNKQIEHNYSSSK